MEEEEDGCLLGCSAVYSGRSLPMFQRSLLPPSSARYSPDPSYQTPRRYNPEDSHLRTHRRENLKSYVVMEV
jgi:hypothetical protein